MSYGKMNTNMQTKSSFIPRWICLWLSFLLWAMALPKTTISVRILSDRNVLPALCRTQTVHRYPLPTTMPQDVRSRR